MLVMMGMQAETVSITFSEQGYSNAQSISECKIGNDITATFSKGTNSNGPKYYNTGTALRLYGRNSMTITAPDNGIINSVIIKTANTKEHYVVSEEWAVTSGTLSVKNATATISDVSSQFVTLTRGDHTGHIRIQTITVNYTIDKISIAAPTLPESANFTSSKTIEIANNTEGATIYYTTDGTEPTTESAQYAEAFTITETTTVMAIAVKDEMVSTISEATYTKLVPMSIEEAKAEYDKTGTATEIAIDLTDAVVTVNTGDYMFIQDDKTGINIYKSGATYAVGTKFTAGILMGTSDAYSAMHQITNASFKNAATTTTTVNPIMVTVAALNADYAKYEGRYVKLSSATLEGTSITQDGNTYTAYDRFNLGFASEYATATICDIEGIPACYNTTLQIFPLTVIPMQAILPKVYPTGSEILEEPWDIEQGTEITITPTKNNVVTYSINDAKATTISQETTIVAESVGTMTLTVTATYGNSTLDATYYYNITESTPKVTATLTVEEIGSATTASYNKNNIVESTNGIWGGYMRINEKSLQINSKSDEGYHIQSPEFPGRVVSVAVTFTTSTSSSSPRGFVIMPTSYTGNTATSSTKGCLGSASYNGTENPTSTATLTSDATSFKIYATDGAIYLSNIEVVYEKPANHTLQVGTTGWATLYLGLDATIPEGLDCYVVSSVADGVATLSQIEGTLPAHTGIIVKANANSNHTLRYKSSYAGKSGIENLLQGTIINSDISGTGYVLSAPDGAVGLYLAKQTDGKFLNNANKAYLPGSAVAATQQSNGFRFKIGETTDIAPSTLNSQPSTVIYDLTGRRVEKMDKGIYIVNGRKVVVK